MELWRQSKNNYTEQRFGGTVKPTPAPGAVPFYKQTRTQASQEKHYERAPSTCAAYTERLSAKPSKEHVLISFQASTCMRSHLSNTKELFPVRSLAPVLSPRQQPQVGPGGAKRRSGSYPLLPSLGTSPCSQQARFVTAPHASSPRGVLGLGTQLWWFNRLLVEQVRPLEMWIPTSLRFLLPANSPLRLERLDPA